MSDKIILVYMMIGLMYIPFCIFQRRETGREKLAVIVTVIEISDCAKYVVCMDRDNEKWEYYCAYTDNWEIGNLVIVTDGGIKRYVQ